MRTAGESRELVQLRPVTVRGPSRRWSPRRSAARTNAPGARPRRLPYASPRLGREQTNASITHGREFPPLGTRPHNATERTDRRHPTRTEVSGALEASSARTPFTTLGGRGQTCFSPDPTISCEESPHRACCKIRRFTVGENSPVEPQLVGVLRCCGPGP